MSARFRVLNYSVRTLLASIVLIVVISTVQGITTRDIQIGYNISVTVSEHSRSASCASGDQNKSNCSASESKKQVRRQQEETLEWRYGQERDDAEHLARPKTGGDWTLISRRDLPDFFIMTYEASKPYSSDKESLRPVSEAQKKPWNEITQKEATQACARLGDNYHLPTNQEWQAAIRRSQKGDIETRRLDDEQKCQTVPGTAWNVNYCLTGSKSTASTSPQMPTNMNGNLWEWTSTIINTSEREFAGTSGYVKSWDESQLWPRELSDNRTQSVRDSWFFASNGTFVIRRGGDWSTPDHNGPYTMSIDRRPSDKGKGIGFRCVHRTN